MGSLQVELPEAVLALLHSAPQVREAYDTSTPQFSAYVESLKALLHLKNIATAQVDAVLRDVNKNDSYVLAARTALKIIDGYNNAKLLSDYLVGQGAAMTITVIQPMYREALRISPRDEGNKHGENALAYKLLL